MAGTPHAYIAACRHNGIRAVLLAAVALLATSAPLAQDRDDAESAWRQAAEAAQAQHAERARRVLRERRLRRISDIAHARMPNTLYASTPSRVDADVSCPVPVETRQRVLRRHREALSRGDVRRASDQRAGAAVRRVRTQRAAVAPAASPAGREQGHAAPATTAASGGVNRHRVPLFTRASDPLRQGFARVVNRSDEAGEISVLAVDDGGNRFGPITLAVGAGATVHFNSADLETGNPGKGLSGGIGAPSEGDWRLEFESSLDFEVRAYLRTRDGFLTAMHDLAPESGGAHRVPIFNPGSNDQQASLLRLVNAGAADVEAVVRGVDDRGRSPGGAVRVAVPAGAARTLSAAQLESGTGPGVESGALGDGAGKWRLSVTADGPIQAMSLLDSPTGTMTNLSTAPPRPDAGDAVHRVPLFPPASDPFRQGFVRVVNRSGQAGDVSVRPSDDSGRDYGAATLAIGANEAVHFNSDDLERGNAAKGLSGGVGVGEGDWRLALRSALDIEVLAYIRTTDGFLTSMHDLAPSSADEHLVATFNPGGNDRQVSLLRLVNDGDATSQVTISGVDDRGAPGRAAVSATVPAGRSLTLSAAQLESGEGSGIVGGALGDGAGKWRLAIASDRPVAAMSLLRSPTDHLTNLSTAPGGAGGDTAAEFFAARVSPVVQSKCVNCHIEGGVSGNTRLVFVRSTDAEHLALNRQAFTDFLAEVEDGAELILNKIQGVAHGGGVQAAAGTEDYASIERYLELIGGESGAAALTPATLFDGVSMAPAWKMLWRAAILFAGRLPTAAEYARAERGPAGLREAIRGVMEGPGFHEFLIRAANDRLLTDKAVFQVISDLHFGFLNLTDAAYALRKAGDESVRRIWEQQTQFGFQRAPLELIAHVVENDLPYTEILTADYVMANPPADAAYGGRRRVRRRGRRSGVQAVADRGLLPKGRLRRERIHRGVRSPRDRPGQSENRLAARGHPQHAGLPEALSDHAHQPQPGAVALDVLPLPRPRRGEVRVPHHGPGGARGYQQPHHAQSRLHGLPRRPRSGRGRVPELRHRGVLPRRRGRVGFAGRSIQRGGVLVVGSKWRSDARTEDEKQTISLSARLMAGSNEIGLQNISVAEGNTNILIDSLTFATALAAWSATGRWRTCGGQTNATVAAYGKVWASISSAEWSFPWRFRG